MSLLNNSICSVGCCITIKNKTKNRNKNIIKKDKNTDDEIFLKKKKKVYSLDQMVYEVVVWSALYAAAFTFPNVNWDSSELGELRATILKQDLNSRLSD